MAINVFSRPINVFSHTLGGVLFDVKTKAVLILQSSYIEQHLLPRARISAVCLSPKILKYHSIGDLDGLHASFISKLAHVYIPEVAEAVLFRALISSNF